MLVSLFAQMQAIGLLGITIPLNLAAQQVDVSAIGSVMALYSVGLIVGALQGKKVISRVGHIRAFAGFAALAACVAILHSFTINAYLCALLRLFSGIAAAVMLVVIESWLASFTSNQNRGRLLALHQITFYLAMGGGQLLINVAGEDLSDAFLIAAMLCCLALMPIVLVKTENPKVSLSSPMSIAELFRISPASMIGAICAGSAIGTVFNLAPIYAKALGVSTFAVSVFMSTLVFAGILLQHPMGRLADRFNRTGVLVVLLGLTAAVSIAIVSLSASLPLWVVGRYRYGIGVPEKLSLKEAKRIASESVPQTWIGTQPLWDEDAFVEGVQDMNEVIVSKEAIHQFATQDMQITLQEAKRIYPHISHGKSAFTSLAGLLLTSE
nr:MFS transporter [Pseudomaricurvus alkylphenolicus]